MKPVSLARTDNRTLYRPPVDPVLIEVPSFEFAMIDGSGDPGTSPDYQAAVAALYAVSYPMVITLKKAGQPDLKVRPLEGLWWADNLSVFQPASEDRASPDCTTSPWRKGSGSAATTMRSIYPIHTKPHPRRCGPSSASRRALTR
jgi:hypothetical protein